MSPLHAWTPSQVHFHISSLSSDTNNSTITSFYTFKVVAPSDAICVVCVANQLIGCYVL